MYVVNDEPSGRSQQIAVAAHCTFQVISMSQEKSKKAAKAPLRFSDPGYVLRAVQLPIRFLLNATDEPRRPKHSSTLSLFLLLSQQQPNVLDLSVLLACLLACLHCSCLLLLAAAFSTNNNKHSHTRSHAHTLTHRGNTQPRKCSEHSEQNSTPSPKNIKKKFQWIALVSPPLNIFFFLFPPRGGTRKGRWAE